MKLPEEILKECAELMLKKRADYSAVDNIHENFGRAEELSNWFDFNVDKIYVTLIGVKLARLATLLNSEKVPNSESIEDSFKDLINYCTLWASRKIKDKNVFINYISATNNLKNESY